MIPVLIAALVWLLLCAATTAVFCRVIRLRDDSPEPVENGDQRREEAV